LGLVPFLDSGSKWIIAMTLFQNRLGCPYHTGPVGHNGLPAKGMLQAAPMVEIMALYKAIITMQPIWALDKVISAGSSTTGKAIT